MKIIPELQSILQELGDVAGTLWQRGWAESNAGNISVDVTDRVPRPRSQEADAPVQALTRSYAALAGRCYLVTGAGTRMREVARRPGEMTCLVCISADGASYRMIHRGSADLHPTSELSMHLAVHERLRSLDRPESAVVHTHPDELIALTHLPEYKDAARLNRLLWSVHPESVIVNPAGVAVVPYTLPGSEELAARTAAEIASHSLVLWEKHGCVAVGPDVWAAYDLIDTVVKAARIGLLCRQAGADPEGLTAGQIEELRSRFLPHGR